MKNLFSFWSTAGGLGGKIPYQWEQIGVSRSYSKINNFLHVGHSKWFLKIHASSTEEKFVNVIVVKVRNLFQVQGGINILRFLLDKYSKFIKRILYFAGSTFPRRPPSGASYCIIQVGSWRSEHPFRAIRPELCNPILFAQSLTLTWHVRPKERFKYWHRGKSGLGPQTFSELI